MSEGLPLVCICIPTFNAGHTIRETVFSLLNQTYSNLIIQIIDNASTDNTLFIVEEFKDPRVHIFRHTINVGGEGNFTRCIELAKGKYTAIYHADDIYESKIVAKQVQYLEANPIAGAVFANATLINARGQSIGFHGIPDLNKFKKNIFDFEAIFKLVLKHSNFLVCPSAMVKTEIYRGEIKKWRGEIFKTSADLDVWFRILMKHPIGILPERLIRYRISEQQGSARLRTRTSRADIFLVFDHYLAQKNVTDLMSATDFRNFSRLVRTDRVIRAVNLYLQGDFIAARELIKGVICIDSFLAAMSQYRGFATLFAGMLLNLVISFKSYRFGKYIFFVLKRMVRK